MQIFLCKWASETPIWWLDLGLDNRNEEETKIGAMKWPTVVVVEWRGRRRCCCRKVATPSRRAGSAGSGGVTSGNPGSSWIRWVANVRSCRCRICRIRWNRAPVIGSVGRWSRSDRTDFEVDSVGHWRPSFHCRTTSGRCPTWRCSSPPNCSRSNWSTTVWRATATWTPPTSRGDWSARCSADSTATTTGWNRPAACCSGSVGSDLSNFQINSIKFKMFPKFNQLATFP